MLNTIRTSKFTKVTALFILINIVGQISFPGVAYALTGGPSQPEVESFEPVGTSEMVDLFSGDFNYNIPLLDVDGYPINISYHSGITNDQEASWVGLGWNINPGVINRNMRGLPDDFSGDKIYKEFNMKPNRTYGVTGVLGAELFGFDIKKLGVNVGFGLGISYNNYNGVAVDRIINANLSAAKGSSTKDTEGLGLGVSMSTSSESGLSLTPSLSFSGKVKNKETSDNHLSGSVGVTFNTRAGLKDLSFGASAKAQRFKLDKDKKAIHTGETQGGTGSSFSLGMNTYIPNSQMPMVNSSVSLNVKLGKTFTGLDFTANVSGYYSEQKLATNSTDIAAYGFMNSDKGAESDIVLLDFNREKEIPYNKNTPALPVTNSTYDIYSVSGQGTGGSYRPFRSEIGHVFDSETNSLSVSGSLGGELGVGGLVKAGADISINYVNNYSGKWKNNNPAAERLNYHSSKEGDPLYEPYYFKQAGEKSVDSDQEFFEKTGGYQAVRIGLGNRRGDMKVPTENKYVTSNGAELVIPTDNTRKKRQKRNESLTLLTRKEAENFGLSGTTGQYSGAREHHIAEVTSLRSDGVRYVYGIAAYNTTQEDVSFSVGKSPNADGRSADCYTGLVDYTTKDNSLGNEMGLDNFYSKTVTPPYAHSYLLTAVLSPDYIDYDAVRGPSSGDLGSYTHFKYQKNTNPYKWRVPFTSMKANYNMGLNTDPTDDQANYVYGEKELWYLDEIVTKNYIAKFIKSDRYDGCGVSGTNGGISTASRMQKLDRIELYAISDQTVPVKVVHFEYDYSLCAGIENFDDPNEATTPGKLTLKKIYFTYGHSKKGRLSPYEFTYNSMNPGYNMKAYDRWGNYKPLVARDSCDQFLPVPNTDEFPYVIQNKSLADLYSSAWSLVSIKLPSGGKINVTYESDDYAYVQDKSAMQMMTLTGVGHQSALYTTSGQLGDNSTYLYFKLPEAIASDADPKVYEQLYLNGIKDVYFRAYVNMLNGISSGEYVSGYAQLHTNDRFGLVSDGVDPEIFTHAYIRLKQVRIGDRENGGTLVNPISKAAWQFGRLNLPRLMNDQPNVTDNGVVQVISALVNSSVAKNIAETFMGPNRVLKTKGYGTSLVPGRSWVRLNKADGFKYGGGSRVKKIVMNDSWSTMQANLNDSEYGQEYEYTTSEGTSSGVASYEPMIGGDENPFRMPVFAGDPEQKLLAPDDKQYLEEPFGESYFPAAQVGYSVVKVKNLGHENVTRNATGHTIHEFYTAKDFPTITERTEIKLAPSTSQIDLRNIFKINAKDYMTVSQGYSIVLNDMHGKPKSQKIYAEGHTSPISGVEYKYKTKSGKLDNEVQTIDKNGNISKKLVGMDFEMLADMREQRTEAIGAGANGNLATFLALIYPAFVVTILPSFSSEYTMFRSAVVTKVINNYGLLDEVVSFDQKAVVATKNMAYDSETGEVLLTRSTNIFGDYLYSMNYPAHWGYAGMGQSYLNIGVSIELNNGLYSGPGTLSSYLFPGDEVYTGTNKGWVTAVSGNTVTLINKAGDKINMSGNRTVKVIRSGHRNQQSVSIGQVMTVKNPLDLNNDNVMESGLNFSNNYMVVNATSSDYSEDGWKTDCNCLQASTNPYVIGLKGTWRLQKEYTYLTDRNQSRLNGNTDVRNDGHFKDFSPFWNKPSVSAEWLKNTNKWTWVSEVTAYSPYGMELENKDALNRYSAAHYGYNNTVPVVVVSNSRHRESGFDGFEDHDMSKGYPSNICDIDGFNFKTAEAGQITDTRSHTGKRSIKVNYKDNEQNNRITKPLNICK